MRIIIKRDPQTIAGINEIEIETPPEWLPVGTYTIEKVLGRYQTYDWGLNKLGQITEAQLIELESLALPKKAAGYRIPTQEENDKAWKEDIE